MSKQISWGGFQRSNQCCSSCLMAAVKVVFLRSKCRYLGLCGRIVVLHMKMNLRYKSRYDTRRKSKKYPFQLKHENTNKWKSAINKWDLVHWITLLNHAGGNLTVRQNQKLREQPHDHLREVVLENICMFRGWEIVYPPTISFLYHVYMFLLSHQSTKHKNNVSETISHLTVWA